MKLNIKLLVLCILIVYAVAFIGSLFTSKSVGSEWYLANKPSLTPPNYVFPIVWNILFFLIALSLYIALKSSKRKEKKKVIFVFGINLFLNILWSFLFFWIKNPVFAFYELILLWLSILTIIIVVWKINKNSAYLLLPYLSWVSFAAILNLMFIF